MKIELLTIVEAAKECRTAVSTFHLWIRQGRIPSLKLGRKRLVRREDLDRFIESGVTVRASPPPFRG